MMFDLLTDTPTSTIGMLISVFLKLGLVILIIVALLSLIRYVRGSFTSSFNKHLHIIETLHLSPKQKLFLIQVGSRTLLLSAADEHISLISEVELPLSEKGAEPLPQISALPSLQTPIGLEFGNLLKNIKSKFNSIKTNENSSNKTTEARETFITNL